MDIVNVTRDTLRAHWPDISESLRTVLEKAPEDWIVEDVYHRIKSGQAACLAAFVNGEYVGVMILTERIAEFSGEKSLHVWIAHNRGDADVMDAGMISLRRMAQAGGAKKITFGSPRVGWAKRHKLVSATYEIGVSE